ncbi:hypothetical protein V2G26_019624 [Clonostachys chloroleuca]
MASRPGSPSDRPLSPKTPPSSPIAGPSCPPPSPSEGAPLESTPLLDGAQDIDISWFITSLWASWSTSYTVSLAGSTLLAKVLLEVLAQLRFKTKPIRSLSQGIQSFLLCTAI